jgi:cell wall-associated NlpC family hydrolase
MKNMIGPRFGRLTVAVVTAVFTVCGLVLAHPAAADPTPGVPDAGARPPAAGTSQWTAGATGGQAAQNVPPVLGPLAQQIRTETIAVQTLSEQLKQVEAEVTRAAQDAEAARAAVDNAQRDVQRLKDEAESAAADAYKASRALGPLGGYASDLHRLSKVAPAIGPRAGSQAAARELARAEDAARTAENAQRGATAAWTTLVSRLNTVKASYDQRVAALLGLRTRNASELARAEAEQDAFESAAGAGFNLGGADGWEAHPLVAKVLTYAMSKRGLPYVWGDEGPNSYDCSGLVWDSYRQVGVMLPRIANQQYNGTTKIAGTDLLPGDLVFFGPAGSWVGIYHVGIYIGGGKMISALNPAQGTQVHSVNAMQLDGYYTF